MLCQECNRVALPGKYVCSIHEAEREEERAQRDETIKLHPDDKDNTKCNETC